MPAKRMEGWRLSSSNVASKHSDRAATLEGQTEQGLSKFSHISSQTVSIKISRVQLSVYVYIHGKAKYEARATHSVLSTLKTF